jgi:hypothetical protein
MDEDGEDPKIKYRKIKYLLLNLSPLSPLTLLSLRPCSHASCLPQLVCRTAASCCAPLLLWCTCLLSAPAVCSVISRDAAASRPPVPPPLITPPPLIVPLSYLLSAWLSRSLSLRQCLLSAGASDSCCTTASSCAPLVPLLHSSWLSCSQQCSPKWTHNF